MSAAPMVWPHIACTWAIVLVLAALAPADGAPLFGDYGTVLATASLPTGAYTNRVPNPTFGADGVPSSQGWTCTNTAAGASVVPANDPYDFDLMNVGPSSGLPFPEGSAQTTGLWVTSDSEVTCTSSAFTLSGGPRGNLWYFQAAAVANVGDGKDLLCRVSLRPTSGGPVVNAGCIKTRGAFDAQGDPLGINSCQAAEMFCRQRLDDATPPTWITTPAAEQPFQPEGADPFDPESAPPLCPLTVAPPWTLGWSFGDKVPDGEYQVVIACQAFYAPPDPANAPSADELAGVTAFDMMFTRMFVGEMAPEESLTLDVPATAGVQQDILVLASYTASDVLLHGQDTVSINFTSAGPGALTCTPALVAVTLADGQAATMCRAAKAGSYTLVASVVSKQAVIAQAPITITTVPSLRLSAAPDVVLLAESSRVNISVQVVDPADGQLAGKSITLFPPPDEAFECAPEQQLSDSAGRAVFSCMPLFDNEGAGALFTASYVGADGNIVGPTNSQQQCRVDIVPVEDAMTMLDPEPNPVSLGLLVTFRAKVVDKDSQGMPGHNVTFTLTRGGAGNFSQATLMTDADGYATLTVTATAPGDLSVAASYISKVGQLFQYERQVIVERPPASLSMSTDTKQVTVNAYFVVHAMLMSGPSPVPDTVVLLDILRGAAECEGAGSGVTTDSAGRAQFRCKVPAASTKEVELQGKFRKDDGTDEVSLKTQKVSVVPAQYKLSITGGPSLFGHSLNVAVGYFFVTGYPGQFVLTLTSPNNAPVANQKLQIGVNTVIPPSAAGSCTPADITTDGTGVARVTCTWIPVPGVLAATGLISFKYYDTALMRATEPSVTQPYVVKQPTQKITLWTGSTTVMQGTTFSATVWVVAAPNLANLMGGRKMEVQISGSGGPSAFECNPVVLNVLGYTRFTCSAKADAQPGPYSLVLVAEDRGAKSRTVPITLVARQQVEHGLNITADATQVLPGAKFKLKARVTSTDGLFAGVPLKFNPSNGITCTPAAASSDSMGLATASCEVATQGVEGGTVALTALATFSGGAIVTTRTNILIATDATVQPTLKCDKPSVVLGSYTMCSAVVADAPTKQGHKLVFAGDPAKGITCSKAPATDVHGATSSKCTITRNEPKAITAQVSPPGGRKSDPFSVAVEVPTDSLVVETGTPRGVAGTRFSITVKGVPIPAVDANNPRNPPPVPRVKLVFNPAKPLVAICPDSAAPDEAGTAHFACSFADAKAAAKAVVIASLINGPNGQSISSNTITLLVDQGKPSGKPLLTLTPSAVQCTSKDQVTLTAKLAQDALPMAQRTIRFTASPQGSATCTSTAGSVTGAATTDARGSAKVTCTFKAFTSDTDVSFTAKYDGAGNATMAATSPKATVMVTAMPQAKALAAAGPTQAVKPGEPFKLTATVYSDTTTQKTMAGVAVNFVPDPASSGGLVCTPRLTAKTDTRGVATQECQYTSKASGGLKTIRVSVPNSPTLNKQPITFTLELPPPIEPEPVITLTLDKPSIAKGQQATCTITAVDNKAGKPPLGATEVKVISTPQGVTCENRKKTDTSGVAYVLCQHVATSTATKYTLKATVMACGGKKQWCPQSATKDLDIKESAALNVEIRLGVGANPNMPIKQGVPFAATAVVLGADGKGVAGAQVTLQQPNLACGSSARGARVTMETTATKGEATFQQCTISGVKVEPGSIKALTVKADVTKDQHTAKATAPIYVDASEPAPEGSKVTITAPAVATVNAPFSVTVAVTNGQGQPYPHASFSFQPLAPTLVCKDKANPAAMWPTPTGPDGKAHAVCTAPNAGGVNLVASLIEGGARVVGRATVDVKAAVQTTETLELSTCRHDAPCGPGNEVLKMVAGASEEFALKARLMDTAAGRPISGRLVSIDLLRGKASAVKCVGPHQLGVDAQTDINGDMLVSKCTTTAAGDFEFQATTTTAVRKDPVSSPTRKITVQPPATTRYKLTNSVDKPSPKLSEDFILKSELVSEADGRVRAPAGVEVSFFGLAPAGVTCVGSQIVKTNNNGVAELKCMSTAAGVKRFDHITTKDPALASGSSGVVNVNVQSPITQYIITTTPTAVSSRAGASWTLTTMVTRADGKAAGGRITVQYVDRVPAALVCTAAVPAAHPGSALTNAAGVATLTCRGVSAYGRVTWTVSVVGADAYSNTNSVSVSITAPPPSPSPPPRPPPAPSPSPRRSPSPKPPPKPPRSEMPPSPPPPPKGVAADTTPASLAATFGRRGR